MAWRNGMVAGAAVSLLAVVFSSTSRGMGQTQDNGAIKINCEQGPCDQVARGRTAFSDGNLKALGGNGRACADCHMPSENFQLSPAVARARFEALIAKLEVNKNADDPLFRPVDADDFRVNGENANNYSNLVDNGLVRVTLPLPPNVRLLDSVTGQPTDETSTDLFRAVIPVMNVAITGPDGVKTEFDYYVGAATGWDWREGGANPLPTGEGGMAAGLSTGSAIKVVRITNSVRSHALGGTRRLRG